MLEKNEYTIKNKYCATEIFVLTRWSQVMQSEPWSQYISFVSIATLVWQTELFRSALQCS